MTDVGHRMALPEPMLEMGAAAHTPGRVWRNRNFGLYLGGNAASWAGLGVADVLFLWLVFSETGSTIAVAAVGVVEAIPPIAVGSFAGVLADRYNQRRLLLVLALTQAGVLGLVPLTLGALGFHLWLVLALILGVETATVVFGPAANAILPKLVGSEGLDSANALTQAFTSVAFTVGTAGAAVLVVALGTLPSFAVNFGVFGAGALLLAFVTGPADNAPASNAPPKPRELLQDLAEGFRFLKGHDWLLQLTLVSVAAGFFVTMFSPFLVVYTVNDLRLPASMFGYLIGGYSAGYFVGSLLNARFHVIRFYGRYFVLAVLGSGGLLALLVAVPAFPVALVALAAMGALMGLLITGLITLVQRVVPSELLGRYLGLQETLVWTVAPLGIVTGGLLIQGFGVSVGFGIAALGLGLVGFLGLVSGRLRSVQYAPGDTPNHNPSRGPPPVPSRLPDLDGGRTELATDPPALPDEVRS